MSFYGAYGKRAVDVLGSAVALVLLCPLLAGTAIAVAVALGRPVLFRQQRPGRGGRLFTLVKFRTMKDGGSDGAPDSDARRLTPFGRRLRATSLDELPELWNVLTGDMSLIGPRPLLPQYLERYSPRQARRHLVRPGITGLAQVSGRNALSWEERLELDVRYVEILSWRLDAWILAATVGAVIGRRGIARPGHVTMDEFRPVDSGGAGAAQVRQPCAERDQDGRADE